MPAANITRILHLGCIMMTLRIQNRASIGHKDRPKGHLFPRRTDVTGEYTEDFQDAVHESLYEDGILREVPDGILREVPDKYIHTADRYFPKAIHDNACLVFKAAIFRDVTIL